MPRSDLPAFLRPRLRLYLSVDLVGSTALKQSGDFPLQQPSPDLTISEAGARWLDDLIGFYREVDACFQREWRNYCETIAPACAWEPFEAPELWKVNGDELIYVAELRSSRHCVAALSCWMKACLSFRTQLHKRGSKLDIKLAAWTAGFPVTNTEVIFERDSSAGSEDWLPVALHYELLERWYTSADKHGSMTRDFIGPSIDIGFRLSAYASPRRFVVGVEVAHILAVTNIPPELGTIRLRFLDMVALKGVLGGRPYPVLWIDTHLNEPLSRSEDELRGSTDLVWDRVKIYCEDFFAAHDAYLLRPFIIDDVEPSLKRIPRNYMERLRAVAAAWAHAKQNQDTLLASVSSASAPEPERERTDAAIPNVQIPKPSA